MSTAKGRESSSRGQESRPRRPGWRDVFNDVATKVTDRVGSPVVLLVAVGVIVVWAITGPLFRFSDTWQLVINTGTTIVTFLMVFVIQTSQNRDSKAVHIKLDELLRAVKGARDEFITTEDATEETVRRRAGELNQVAAEAKAPHSGTGSRRTSATNADGRSGQQKSGHDASRSSK